ncbi:MAG: hypothetical protein PHX83_10325 [Acidobacteriia bacterium]|nr:hypothetical protein [Terriglobia bacterium]
MLIGIDLVLGLLAVAVLAWDILSGQIGSMDGNFLLLVCVVFAGMFLGGAIGSIRKGEFKKAPITPPEKKISGGESTKAGSESV